MLNNNIPENLGLVIITIAVVLLCSCAGKPASSPFAPPQHSWGDPNIQGAWDYRTATPLAVPPGMAGRTHFTDAEKDEFENGATARGVAFVRRVGNFVGDEPWADRGQMLTEDTRAALIVDPPSGQMPPRTRYGKQLFGRYFAQLSGVESTGPEDRTILERCIVAPLVPLRPLNFNNNVSIVQSPSHVVIMTEMVHGARIVPIQRNANSLRRLGVPQWYGESIGHWEHNTLVVETINFRAYENLLGTSANLQLVEKFTLANNSQLTYEYTISDPDIFSKPWTARQTLNRLDGKIYEYACHEGNISMKLMLHGARVAEQTTTSH